MYTYEAGKRNITHGKRKMLAEWLHVYTTFVDLLQNCSKGIAISVCLCISVQLPYLIRKRKIEKVETAVKTEIVFPE